MSLNAAQKKQMALQRRLHRHKRYSVDIELAPGYTLNGLIVGPGILRPEVTTSLYLARYLFFRNGLYLNKRALDLGSGCGIQGIVLGLYGAKDIVFSDITRESIRNTTENVKRFRLSNNAKIIRSDLFQNIRQKFDRIVFNHPFFPDVPKAGDIFEIATLAPGELIQRFLKNAKTHLYPDGVIVMPYFHLGGPINDPAKQAPKHGYSVRENWRLKIHSGSQQGLVSIYELRLQ
ncbi:MAG: hypothetical protein A3B30_03880 [Candidatus Komeilibacteria bacterium RIFCSPLOWO2_01_FULL_52_15]|uniref:Methyltransferase small domain-containing protein n=2 Tax=Candidatus Komeiliibacteriota TaxID=1817908 RepID=A0A1G2BQZ8_9BACT|nr:MAG: hypothetical protein A2677_03310 [Candidatus Komeilibacteria bacterium RIFCSPHIGHO2_01_FULL_52_14]OGY91488.1 MAG: hypothetical protein A3B30_03880 [Candidatus Komeilibacteria bacterium RIFCSPLOWO2_01_FULL_52_15]